MRHQISDWGFRRFTLKKEGMRIPDPGKDMMREEISKDMQAFLDNGGEIQVLGYEENRSKVQKAMEKIRD